MMNPFFAQELEDVQNEIDKQRFRIDGLASLTWAMRKLQAIESKKKEVNQVADQEIQNIEQYRKSELDKLVGNEEFFKGLIAEYAILKRQEDPKYKSEKTPYGSIGFRVQQPKWHYNDQAVIQHLKENGFDGLIRIKEEPVKTEIKKAFEVHSDGRVFDSLGQAVEGITVEFLPESFDVKVGGGS